ncbi:MAG: bifunctional histidinol-phosphatase/imidazoleglycerol-phosphate dehydratase HisB [Proteobacteria bacterium]|nr:bifunctional histidinol-phosphatase/imidazoleglycerol-phosphate dehydratase HisB [Pseudomonadota bacterium]MDA0994587.1 bifunctional histidinol-phosphatase/imidazoleglycerol-phosphate dehydratase HisB [Pseudomonadota bacterium]
MARVLFIDRDGTLIEEPADHQVDSLEKVRLVPGVIRALHRLIEFGYRLVMVTNQDGLGTASFPMADFDLCQNHILSLFATQGIEFDDVFVCPHIDADNCDCRKPKAGLLTKFLTSNALETGFCAVIGDRETDLQLAENLGVRGLLIGNTAQSFSWDDIVTALTPGNRIGFAARTTNETDVQVRVNLDAAAPIRVNTGIGFYDHMLQQVAKHGGFSIDVQCKGDLNVDEHHTVEDTALSLGKAIRDALGDKLGISRYGFLLPMDESEARVSLDLSGRPLLVFDGSFPRSEVGQLPTELVRHCFHSLADALGATLHIAVTGENTHHMVEACFKAFGRALRQAIHVESTDMPSTKGCLS